MTPASAAPKAGGGRLHSTDGAAPRVAARVVDFIPLSMQHRAEWPCILFDSVHSQCAWSRAGGGGVPC
jgi:hypothetical protein